MCQQPIPLNLWGPPCLLLGPFSPAHPLDMSRCPPSPGSEELLVPTSPLRHWESKECWVTSCGLWLFSQNLWEKGLCYTLRGCLRLHTPEADLEAFFGRWFQVVLDRMGGRESETGTGWKPVDGEGKWTGFLCWWLELHPTEKNINHASVSPHWEVMELDLWSTNFHLRWGVRHSQGILPPQSTLLHPTLHKKSIPSAQESLRQRATGT